MWIKKGMVFGLAIALVQPAFAKIYPWVEIGADDIQVVEDPRVEAAIRLDLIRNAESTIDIITYDQRPDLQISIPLLRALREAADRPHRPVKIRFITSWIIGAALDMNQVVPRYLTQPPTREPIRLIVAGGTRMKNKNWVEGVQQNKRNWNLLDGAHEKLFFIDQKILLTTGRGQVAEYLDWIDTGFLIRGPLVQQAHQAYREIWRTLREESGITSVPASQRASRFAVNYDREYRAEEIPLDLGGGQSQELDRLQSWVRETQLGGSRENAPRLRARVLHHDFLNQMRSRRGDPSDLNEEQRIGLLEDSVLDAMVERLKKSRQSAWSTLSVILHPRLRAAIDAALDRGASVTLFTNSRAAYENIAPVAAPWILGLPEIFGLLTRNRPAKIYAFDPGASSPYRYLHRKIALFDDAVLFGSHNFNLPSTVSNDEVGFEVEGAAFVEPMKALFMRDLRSLGKPLHPREVAKEEKTTAWQRPLLRGFSGIF